MISDDYIALEYRIVEECKTHRRNHCMDANYSSWITFGSSYLVKFNVTEAEIQTQTYFSTYAESLVNKSDVPRIPKPLHHFQRGSVWYLVMEHINFVENPQDVPRRIAQAVKWLSEVPPPPGHEFGPLGGGPINHVFFKWATAPLEFTGIAALERYIEWGRTWLLGSSAETFEPVLLTGQRVMFTQDDLRPTSFGVDDQGRTVIRNFESVAMLPESFVQFSLLSNPAIGQECLKALGMEWKESHLKTMSTLSAHLQMFFPDDLHLDKDGYFVPSE
ncbi:hypothetical protein D9613_012512 [Agrocybe pediades]|uniref:Aminoglycoside phosphotransferase domain-containing protein n=1 Tax=Agrocybe pediades TaxID=84607 RepID=A0A8H4VPU8_9AGAR|nr:hypothetical protein D9613_012512 [Agrocybe pediades]